MPKQENSTGGKKPPLAVLKLLKAAQERQAARQKRTPQVIPAATLMNRIRMRRKKS